MKLITKHNGYTVLAGLVLALITYVLITPACVTIGSVKPVLGSQGYRMWSDDTFKSFEHNGKKVCVLDGWVSLGEVSIGDGWVTFADGDTGVLYRKNAFKSTALLPEGSEYAVTLMYPEGTSATDLTTYVALTENAFAQVGRIYGDEPLALRKPHTMLVTAGLAGDTRTSETRVYPDPTLQLSSIVRTPDQPRSEELLIHAVMHLYNRHALDGTAYLSNQAPYSAEEFEELEATWAELALSTNSKAVQNRLQYLYQVHAAVQTKNFALISDPPFDDETGFKLIRPTVFVPKNAGYLEFQYGHYVLAPLLMATTDALLSERRTGTTVAKLLTEVHSGGGNFTALLSTHLKPKDMETLGQYSRGEAQIPYAYIERAMKLY
jgi:hypothetical protein